MNIQSRLTGILAACVIGMLFLSSPSAAEGICVSGYEVEVCGEFVGCEDGSDIEVCTVDGEEECYDLTCGENTIRVCCHDT